MIPTLPTPTTLDFSLSLDSFSSGLLLPPRGQTHQAVTQAAGVRGVGEVCSVGVLFPTEGTAWGRGQL